MINNLEHQHLDHRLLAAYKDFLSANKFGAVVDGMNVAKLGQQTFSHENVCMVIAVNSPNLEP